MEKNSDLVAIGKKIRFLRKKNGFSQEDLANEIGMARSFFGCVERAEKSITAANLIKIAKALKVQVGDLFPLIEYKDVSEK